MKRKLTITVAIVIGAAIVAAVAYGIGNKMGRSERHERAATDLSQVSITLEQAVAAAQQSQAGSKALEAELKKNDNNFFYKVKVLSPDKQWFRVKVDARDGKVISSQPGDHDEEIDN